jgi:arabinogalactan endo-1,4-beta-galactosidase
MMGSSIKSAAGDLPILGADVSSLQCALDLGAKYCYENGVQGDPLQILQDHGINYLRLRVWVDPANGYNNMTKVAQFASQVKVRGMKLLINLHYSDTWADPAHQVKPAAWGGYRFGQLKKAVFNHTGEVCHELEEAGVVPDMVQIGNEINPGMLLPDGSAGNWDHLSALLQEGYRAVKACCPSAQVMIHIANAGDKAGARLWFDNAKMHKVQWDITGLSYYSYWHGAIAAMKSTVKDMKSRYGKPVVIVETAYPFTLLENDGEKNSINPSSQLPSDYPATPSGQESNLRDVLSAACSGGALGVFYWEPTWTAVKGNGWDPTNPNSGDQWENQALFDFSGVALPAMGAFRR